MFIEVEQFCAYYQDSLKWNSWQNCLLYIIELYLINWPESIYTYFPSIENSKQISCDCYFAAKWTERASHASLYPEGPRWFTIITFRCLKRSLDERTTYRNWTTVQRWRPAACSDGPLGRCGAGSPQLWTHIEIVNMEARRSDTPAVSAAVS